MSVHGRIYDSVILPSPSTATMHWLIGLFQHCHERLIQFRYLVRTCVGYSADNTYLDLVCILCDRRRSSTGLKGMWRGTPETWADPGCPYATVNLDSHGFMSDGPHGPCLHARHELHTHTGGCWQCAHAPAATRGRVSAGKADSMPGARYSCSTRQTITHGTAEAVVARPQVIPAPSRCQ